MKTIFSFIATISFILTIISSCTEEINHDTALDAQIFIFGELTSTIDHVTITIHKTVALDNKGLNPVKNAKIALMTKTKNGETSLVTNNFNESKGEYQSKEKITPITGSSYWIEVQLPDGENYISSPETLKKPVPIDTITVTDTGIKIHFEDPKNEANFYTLILEHYENQNFLYQEIELTSDILFDGNDDAFIELPNFNKKNEIEVSLINLNFDSYSYFTKIVNQNDEIRDGASEGPSQLFATPPTTLQGNITNTNSKKQVLGHFGVLSISNQYFSF